MVITTATYRERDIGQWRERRQLPLYALVPPEVLTLRLSREGSPEDTVVVLVWGLAP